MFDVQAIRSLFPSVNRNDAIFLDNPAGTQVSHFVIDGVTHYYLHANANSGGYFTTSQRTDELVLNSRQMMRDFLNAPSADEIVFGPNMTTLNMSLSRAIAQTLQSGDEIILTRMDHDANVAPWLLIARDKGLTVRWIDLDPETGRLNLDTYAYALNERTRLVATVHASNALGTINPVQQIAEMAHQVGALHVVDAVQSAPHIPIDVQAIGCDFLLCSAYKFFGPHIGILWGRYDLLESLPAYKVRPAKDKTPYRWETGTPSFETIYGTAKAIDYFQWMGEQYGQAHLAPFAHLSERAQMIHAGVAVSCEYEQHLVGYLIQQLATLPKIRVFGITDPAEFVDRVPTVIFAHDDFTSHQVAEHLAKSEIYVWSGNYYAQEAMERLGYAEHGLVRVGLVHYNTMEEVDRLIETLHTL